MPSTANQKVISKKETASMYTRDGVRLDADIYRPEAEGKFPVLLMRQPYGRAIASTVVYAHPRWYAAQGYIVVIQDVRGRGTSQGKFALFTHEIEDGLDSVNWAAQLPGSTGKVGMYGFSYQGMTQLYAAAARPSSLKVICPSMVAYDLYNDWAYEGNAFCLQSNLSWAIQLAAETARLQDNQEAFRQLYFASRNLTFHDTVPSLLSELAPESFYHQWLKYPQTDPYWQKLSPKYLIEDVELPMLHIGGWFDPYLRGTLHLYHQMAAKATSPQHLIIGAWAHLPWGRKVGAMDYGAQAASPVDELQIRWFDQFLKDKDTGILAESPVRLFEMGSNRWRYEDSFPNNNQQAYYLSSNGLASIRDDAGKLEFPSSSPIPNYQDFLVHDPWRAVPTLGGHASFPPGAFDRSSLDCRSDVLTYTSKPLAKDLYLAGAVAVEVYATADAPSFDLCAVLSEVYPDGSVYNFTQGYICIRLAEVWGNPPLTQSTPKPLPRALPRRMRFAGFARLPGGEARRGMRTKTGVKEEELRSTPIRINLQATCIRLKQGNSLRLSLSAACFPAYPINPGTGALPQQTGLMDAKVITITVHSGVDYPSGVLLPIINTGTYFSHSK